MFVCVYSALIFKFRDLERKRERGKEGGKRIKIVFLEKAWSNVLGSSQEHRCLD